MSKGRAVSIGVSIVCLALAGMSLHRPSAYAQMTTTVAQQSDALTAEGLFQQGMQRYREGSAESLRAAIALWQQAAPLYKSAGNLSRQASVLNNIGSVYGQLGQRREALPYYEQALTIRREISDRSGEANILSSMGGIYFDLGDRESALNYYNQSLALSRELDDKAAIGTALSKLGHLSYALGNKEDALSYFNQALSLSREIGSKDAEARILNGLGLLYYSLGDHDTALTYYNNSIDISRGMGDRAGIATTLNNIGSVYEFIGDKTEALTYYNQALTLAREIGDRSGESGVLNNMGGTYSALGEPEKALENYNQALAIRQQIGDVGGEASTLNNIGLIYNLLGEPEKALAYYNQALPQLRQVGDRAAEAKAIGNIAMVYQGLNKTEEALTYFNQALVIAREINDPANEATMLNNIGTVYSAMGEKEKALTFYTQALPLRRQTGNKGGEAVTLNNTGNIYLALDDPAEALTNYSQALVLSRQIGDRAGEAVTLNNTAVAYKQQGNLPEALTAINAAITLIEDLRLAISPGDLRASYFSTVQDSYQLQLDIQMQLGQLEAAFETSEASRARLLLELLSESNVNIRQGVDATLLQQEQSLKGDMAQLEQRRISLRSGNHSPEQAAALDEQSDALLQQLDQVIAQIRRISPAYAEIVQPQPLTLPQVQQDVLEADTVLVQYALGKDQSYLWLVGKDNFKAYTLPAEADIQKVAQQFQSAISNQGSTADVKRKGDQLVAQILPEQPNWIKGKRLLVAGDGILARLPFAALPQPNTAGYTPLLAEHEILTQPSITAVSVLRQQLSNRPPAASSLAILADPVYRSDDERLGAASQAQPDEQQVRQLPSATERNLRDLDLRSIERLPFTRTESDRILQLAEQSGIESTQALDFAANVDWVTSPQLENYSLLHLATHGFINPVNPQLSGIVLSLVDEQGQLKENGFLRLHDIFNLKLAAELVVLSACQTGQGENISGEGIVGLSRGFMYAGAERVAVSLWNVNDQATADLMSEFYQYLLADDMTPPAAMRAAQLDAWQAGQSPYLWAAFTLQGEWQ
ncbi:MAG: tetratricopeptide repeat protein [Cyanobacteria bacterium J06598_3]